MKSCAWKNYYKMLYLLVLFLLASCSRPESDVKATSVDSGNGQQIPTTIDATMPTATEALIITPSVTLNPTNTDTSTPQIIGTPKSKMVFYIHDEFAFIDPYSPNDIEYVYSPSLRSLPNPRPSVLSPDGTKLIIRAMEAGVGRDRLFILDLETGATRKLIYESAAQMFPRWSPDGKRIAFVLRYENESGIYIFDLENDELTSLPGGHRWDFEPYWSPDGNKIYFISYNSEDYIPPKDIFVIDSDGKNIRKLTEEPIKISDFSLSPDGSKFVLTSQAVEGDILTLSVDGSNLKNISENLFPERNPEWSPDSSKIAFSSKRDGNWEIYVMDSDGKNVERLTNNSEVDTPMQWSPHGEYLAFVSDRTGSPQIYIYIFSNNEVRQITNEEHYPYLSDIWGITINE